MKTYLIGDIHGEYNKLINCLKSVNFDYEKDTLIQLGDVVDRGKDSFLVVEELTKIKNLIAIKGNHDKTWWDSILKDVPNLLFNQGGKETLESYIKHCNPDKSWGYDNRGIGSTDFNMYDIPIKHVEFFSNQLNYYIDKNNSLFVHGGFNRHHLIEEEKDLEVFLWDRDLLHSARSYSSMKNNEYPFQNKNNFKEIFIGHTPTIYFGSLIPLNYVNIWDLDTGCGKGGLLTIMDLETKEFKQF